MHIYLLLYYYYPKSNRVLAVGVGWLIKYGWLKHCVAVNRWFGSRTRTLRNNDNASFGAAVNISSNGIGEQSSHVKPRDGNGNAIWSGQLVLDLIQLVAKIK